MRHLDTVSGAVGLAEEILGRRRRPIVVISSAHGGGYAFDPDHVAREVGASADVVTIATGEVTYALEGAMPEKSHVFGGAARSYPPDFGSAPDWRRSLLRFPDRHDVNDLIEDALAQVTVVATHPSPVRRAWVSGTVELVSGMSGNVARLDDGQRVSVVADLLPANISLAAGLVVGGPVEGWLSGRDLSPEAADADISRFEDGAVTLARVVKVTPLRAQLSLHPLLGDVTLRRRDVIAGVDAGENAEVQVTDVLRVGETVRARVVRSGGGIGLSLVGADVGAPLVAPLPLLRGGPPWLREGVQAESTPVQATDAVAIAVDTPQAAAESPVVAPLPAAGAAEFSELRGEIGELRGAIGRLARELRSGTDLETLDRLRDEVTGLEAELQRERGRRRERDLMIARLNQEVREARASRPAATSADRRTPRDAWPDGEAWIRHEVLCTWATRTVAGEKGHYPIADYAIGPGFVKSVEALDDGAFAKAMRAVVDVVTGRAAEISGRQLHRLRQGLGGDDPYVERADGAKCWRVSIEANVPSARRLHYWQLPGGRVELSRVVLHDDVEP